MKRQQEHLLFHDPAVVETKKKERQQKKFQEKKAPVVHRDILKKTRNKSRSKDEINKRVLYLALMRYRSFYERLKKMRKWKQTPELIEKIKSYECLMKKAREDVMELYITTAKILTRHHHFVGYTPQFKYDMVLDALVKGLSIGKEGNHNYGLMYMARFNFSRGTNVFSWWQQQIKHFFYLIIGDMYKFKNNMQVEFLRIVSQFDYDAINVHGVSYARFHIGTVMDKKDR